MRFKGTASQRGVANPGEDAGRAEAYFCASRHNVDLFCNSAKLIIWGFLYLVDGYDLQR
jgi:hypothetical protein